MLSESSRAYQGWPCLDTLTTSKSVGGQSELGCTMMNCDMMNHVFWLVQRDSRPVDPFLHVRTGHVNPPSSSENTKVSHWDVYRWCWKLVPGSPRRFWAFQLVQGGCRQISSICDWKGRDLAKRVSFLWTFYCLVFGILATCQFQLVRKEWT